MNQTFKAVLKSFGFILLYLLINTVIIVGYFAVSESTDIDDISPNAMTAMLIATQIIVLLIILIMYKKQFPRFVRFKKTSPKILLWAFIIGLAGINISALLITVMDVIFPDQMADYIEAIEGSIGGASFLLSFTAAVLLAPLVEEIAMRGMLFRWFEKTNVKPWVIIVLSGLFFGIFHLNLIQGVFATSIGILYALAFYMTKSLWVPIVMHFANNAYAVLAGYLPETLMESPWFILINYLTILLIPIGFYYIRKELKKQE